jgi:carbon storage regulator
MLILSRKTNQKIMIGEDISVSIIEVKNDQVKIGVEAPRHVKVFREEVFEEIKSETRAAAESNALLRPLPEITES